MNEHFKACANIHTEVNVNNKTAVSVMKRRV